MNHTPDTILALARIAAQTASDQSELKQTTWFPCGFASIIIRPARGKFITYLKSQGIGSKNYGGGYRLSSYDVAEQSRDWCQSMNVKEDAVRAAVLVLNENGINAHAESRMD